MLRQASHTVKVHVVHLGVGATVYQDIPNTLEELVPRGPSTAALMGSQSIRSCGDGQEGGGSET